MKFRTLLIATLIGVGLQVAMVVAGHFIQVLRESGFAIGGMALSALAGWLYARMARGGWGDSLVGGAVAGGVCAAVGIAVSAALGDVPWTLLVLGTAGSIGAGVVGAAIGRLLRT